MDPQAPYHVSKPTTAPTKAASCGLPIECTLAHDEPVIFQASGEEMHDRVQVTVSMKQLAYICEAVDRLRSAGLSDPDGLVATREAIGELSGQLWGFWRGVLHRRASHAGAHARALRLSNRDVFHSPEGSGK